MSRIYDLLARVYDQPEHLEVTAAFHRAILPLVRTRPRGTWVLDVACGTGVLAEKLARGRCPVVGVDGSPEMLAIARKRCRPLGSRVRLVTAQLDDFQVHEPCAVASASGDVFNHVLTRRPLVRILRRIRSNLLPGGVLIFDSLNRFCYENYWAGHDYLLESERGDLAMCCEWDPEQRLATARMVGYVRVKGGRYEKFETELIERYHGNREFRSALSEAGFHRIEREAWSPWPDQHLEPSLDRNLWTARVPGKRVARGA